MNNNISFILTEEERTQLTDAIKVLETILESKLISLSPDDKKELPKMGNRTLSFVEKSFEYGDVYPSFIPDFIDLPEAKIDLESVRTLRQLFLPLERITNQIDDTMTLAGSEAYSTALSIYKILKNAENMGQPGAAEANAELKKRFPRGKKNTEPIGQ